MRQCFGSLMINLSDCGGNRELSGKVLFCVSYAFFKEYHTLTEVQ